MSTRKFVEPNVDVRCKISGMCQEVASTADRYFRSYAPECVVSKVDSLLDKKGDIEVAVRGKMNDVMDACEKIVDYYIPDESNKRPDFENESVFARMNYFSHDLSGRICTRYLPFITNNELVVKQVQDAKEKVMEKVKEYDMKPIIENTKESISKVKDQCVEKVKPIVEPFSPVLTPLFSLIALFFSTIHLFIRIAIIDPINTFVNMVKDFISKSKKEFEPDEQKKYPIVQKANGVYEDVKSKLTELFTDDKGKVTMEKFQLLCKEKSSEYEKLVKENITAENLQHFLDKSTQKVKDQMSPVMKAGEEGQKYYEELIKFFSDENGKFTAAKIQGMAGQSTDELKKLVDGVYKNLNEQKDTIVKGAEDKVNQMKNQFSVHYQSVKDVVLSMLTLFVAVLVLFPTVNFLIFTFILSYFVDLKKIVPSPTVEKLMKAAECVDKVENKTEEQKPVEESNPVEEPKKEEPKPKTNEKPQTTKKGGKYVKPAQVKL